MIRGVVLFVPRVICAVMCVAVIWGAALPLMLLGREKS
jgi:hypothetical protein